MSNLLYLLDSDNEVRKNLGSLVPSASSSNSLLPASGAAILPVAEAWRSTGAGSEYLEIDFGGSGVTGDFVAVVNTNIRSGAVTFRVAVDTVTPPVAFTENLPDPINGTSWVELASTQTSKQYWRIELADTGNPDGYLEIGYIVIGVKSDWAFKYGPTFTKQHTRLNRRSESPFGIDLNGSLVSSFARYIFDFGGSGGVLSKVEGDGLDTFLNLLRGRENPFFMVPDQDTVTSSGIFCRLDSDGWSQEFNNKGFSTVGEVVFKEENPGPRFVL